MLRSSLHLIFTLLFIFRTKLFINNRISGKTSNILLNKHNTHTRNVGFFSHEHFSFVEEKQKLLQNKKIKIENMLVEEKVMFISPKYII